MRLELDIGNTFVKWRLLNSKGAIQDRGRVETRGEVAAFISGSYFFLQVNELLVSSVSSLDLERAVCDLFEARHSPVSIFTAKAEKKLCGVEFVYKDVGCLGVDRCLAMVAAYNRCRHGVLVIDCGSAMTADLISATGRHIGGYIFPGFRLLKQSLLSGTSNVIVNAEVEQSFGLGKNTEECVENGVLMMMRSTLLGLMELAANNDVFDVLLTGGDGVKAKTLLGEKVEYDKDLVFKGLGMVSPYSLGE